MAAPLPATDRSLNRNAFRLYHMLGNVREWTADAATQAGPSIVDGLAVPPPPASGAVERIVRGGSFRQPPEASRVAARTGLTAGRGYPDVGFRIVRSV